MIGPTETQTRYSTQPTIAEVLDEIESCLGGDTPHRVGEVVAEVRSSVELGRPLPSARKEDR